MLCESSNLFWSSPPNLRELRHSNGHLRLSLLSSPEKSEYQSNTYLKQKRRYKCVISDLSSLWCAARAEYKSTCKSFDSHRVLYLRFRGNSCKPALDRSESLRTNLDKVHKWDIYTLKNRRVYRYLASACRLQTNLQVDINVNRKRVSTNQKKKPGPCWSHSARYISHNTWGTGITAVEKLASEKKVNAFFTPHTAIWSFFLALKKGQKAEMRDSVRTFVANRGGGC